MNDYKISQTRGKYQSGFTLAEVMVALAVVSFVAVGLIQFNILLSRNAFDSRETVEVAQKIRSFTTNLSRDGRMARQIMLYEGMPSSVNDLHRSQRLADDQTGDLVVFLHVSPEPINEARERLPQRFYFERLIAYARVPDPTDSEGRGPVIRFEVTASHLADSDVEVWDNPGNNLIAEILAEMLIPDDATTNHLSIPARSGEIVELARGLANNNLFRNYRDNSIVVNGEIVAGNFRREDGRIVVRGNRFVNNTYNFTITRQG